VEEWLFLNVKTVEQLRKANVNLRNVLNADKKEQWKNSLKVFQRRLRDGKK
jgi:hypothetical protein